MLKNIETMSNEVSSQIIETISIPPDEPFVDEIKPANPETTNEGMPALPNKIPQSKLQNALELTYKHYPYLKKSSKIYEKSTCRIDNIIYNTGLDKSLIDTSVAIKLTDELGAIIDKVTGQPILTFKLQNISDYPEKTKIYNSKNSFDIQLTQNEVQSQPFDLQENKIQKPNETEQQYATRMESLERLQDEKFNVESIKTILLEKLMSDPSPKIRKNVADFLITNPSPKEIIRFSSEIPDYEAIINEEIAYLESSGYIQKEILSNGKEILIADTSKFSKNNKFPFRTSPDGLYNLPQYGDNNVYDTLQLIYGNLEVISKEDYQQSEDNPQNIQTKPLFYFPETSQKAIDPVAIKETDFYLAPWQIHSSLDSASDDIPYDVKEASLACLIFHPNYGDGGYDEDGNLYFKDANTREYRPFSTHHIKEEYHTNLGTRHTAGESLATKNRLYAQKHCKNLIGQGILKYEYFKDIDIKNTHKPKVEKMIFDTNYKIRSHGASFINYVEYRFGKGDNLPQKAMAAKLTEKTGCVFDTETGDILQTFDLKNVADLENDDQTYSKQTYNNKKIGITLTKKQTDAKDFDHDQFYTQKSNETEQEYQARIESLEQFKYKQIILRQLDQTNEPIVFDMLPINIRKMILENRDNLSHLSTEDLAEFKDEFGPESLETLATTSAILKNSDLIELSKSNSNREILKNLLDNIKTEISDSYLKIYEVLQKISPSGENNQILSNSNIVRESLSQFLTFSKNEMTINPNITLEELNDRVSLSNIKNLSDIKYEMIRESSILLAQSLNIEASEISNLDIKTQQNFLYYLDKCPTEEIDQIHQFAKEFGVNGVKTFLSIDYGKDMGKNILNLSESHDKETTNAIFSKYAEITDSAENVLQFLHENFSNSGENITETEDKIIQNLLKKGRDLLMYYSSSQRKDAEGIIQELEMIKTNLLLTATTFKILKQENPDLKLEDLNNVETEIIYGSDIKSADQKELLDTLEANWNKNEFESIYPILQAHMKESFNNPNIRYSIARSENSILTFQRFEDVDPGIVYASGNNVHPSARGSRIGEATQKSILGHELENNMVIADAYPKSDIFQHYINKSGFNGVGIYKNFENTGQPYVCMVNEPVKNHHEYYWRQKTPSEIITSAQADQIDPSHPIVQVKFGQLPTGSPETDRRSLQIDEQTTSFLEPYFAQDFIITGIAQGPNDTLYFAMEQDQANAKIRVIDNEYKILSNNY